MEQVRLVGPIAPQTKRGIPVSLPTYVNELSKKYKDVF